MLGLGALCILCARTSADSKKQQIPMLVQKDLTGLLYLWWFGIAIAGGLRVFNIEDFGAKSDGTYSAEISMTITTCCEGKTLNTQAIVRAIAAASASGGGNVVVPKGTFITGGKTAYFTKS